MKKILDIAYYEVVHIFKDPILFLIVFIAPLAYASLFGVVYFSGILTDIPLGVVNMDNSQLSREVAEAFANDNHFKIVEDINTYPELEKGMKEGTVRAGVVIPEDLEKKISLHQNAEVLTVYDGSNLIWGYNIRKNAREVIQQFSVKYTAGCLAGMGLDRQEMANIMNTVDCNITTWYNPTYSYGNFLFMGLMMMVIHQLGLLGVSLTVTREKEKNSWIQYLAGGLSGWKIMLGKCIPYLIANFFNYTLLLWVSAAFVNVKIQGSIFLIIILGLLYDIIITFAGFFVSVHANNSLQVTRYLMLLSVPFFMISGYTWPATHIPAALNGAARLLPFTWMANGFREVTIKTLTLQEMGGTILALGIMAILAIGLALTFKKQGRAYGEASLTVNCGTAYPRKK